MIQKERIKIDYETIELYSLDFLATSQSNPFCNRNVFFTQGLKTSKYIEFQIIGNLGGLGIDYEFSSETDFYIIADNLIADLKEGKTDHQLDQLEKKLNAKGNKYEKLKILSESAFLQHIRQRCDAIGDNVTSHLVNLAI